MTEASFSVMFTESLGEQFVLRFENSCIGVFNRGELLVEGSSVEAGLRYFFEQSALSGVNLVLSTLFFTPFPSTPLHRSKRLVSSFIVHFSTSIEFNKRSVRKPRGYFLTGVIILDIVSTDFVEVQNKYM